MKKLSVLLSEDQFEELNGKAVGEGLSITDFVIKNLPITKENKVTMADVLARVDALPTGEFNIPSLFTLEEWQAFTRGSRIAIGRQFFKELSAGIRPNVEYIDKNAANLAVYKKF